MPRSWHDGLKSGGRAADASGMTVADSFELTRGVRRPAGRLVGAVLLATLVVAGAGLQASGASGGDGELRAPCQARADDVAALDVQAAGGTVCR
jgi:hypothetical protein